MPKGVRLALPVLHQALALGPPQVIALARQARCGAIGTIFPSLEDKHIDSLGCQLTRHQSGAQAAADNYDRAIR
jgi:hypothetical protein